VGFVPVRKGGKLPVRNERVSFKDYSGAEKTLELRADPWPRGTKVLVTDEWIETGATAKAAVELVERAGGIVVGVTAIAFRKNVGTAELWAKYRCHGVWPEQA
jgi:adenine phosphoribosyltransferase